MRHSRNQKRFIRRQCAPPGSPDGDEQVHLHVGCNLVVDPLDEFDAFLMAMPRHALHDPAPL
jgi:hypothetical protein